MQSKWPTYDLDNACFSPEEPDKVLIQPMSILWRMSVLCLAVLSFSVATKADTTDTANRCGVDQNKDAYRIFADPDGKNWKEYSKDSLPELTPDVGASVVLMWVAKDGKTLFSIRDPEEDFSIYTDYCFNSTGDLIQLRYELRTAWGWGYRTEGPVVKSVLESKTSEFFAMSTGAHLEKPDGADDLPWATKPKLYAQKSRLPFFALLKK